MTVQRVLDWLVELPALALYAALAATAALENIFPPLPADTVVAFGSFLAARGERSLLPVFLSTWGGNIAGAAVMYAVGRRFGRSWIRNRFGRSAEAADRTLQRLYGRYGLLALFASRFLPGVRGLVPPLAGAFDIPALPAIAVMAFASGLWYGFVTWLAFRVGASWDQLLAALGSANKWVTIAVGILAASGLALWLVRRHRANARQ